MKGDEKLIKEEIKDEIFYKPAYSLIPAFVGFPMAVASFLIGKSMPLITGIGVGLSLLSVGLYAARVAFNWRNAGKIRDKIVYRRAREAEKAVNEALARARAQLVSDGDPQTEEMFDRLLALQNTVSKEIDSEVAGLEGNFAIQNVEELVSTSIRNLEESVQLLRKAEETSIESLEKASLDKRNELIEETRKSIQSIERILMAFIDNRKNYSVAESARIREELDSQLEISRRVQEKMDDWQISPTNIES
ncbi:MAG: hypothetical protein AAGJ81_02480 [Verrucomicrobiota bacterium]